jgi:hypothetical protein
MANLPGFIGLSPTLGGEMKFKTSFGWPFSGSKEMLDTAPTAHERATRSFCNHCWELAYLRAQADTSKSQSEHYEELLDEFIKKFPEGTR